MLDINNDGTVDFNELLVVIVLSSRLNDMESRLTFAFDTLVIIVHLQYLSMMFL
jgi:hypothetical protein